MPKHSRLFVKPFIGGLNTETSSVEDAILNTADELNCTILPEGIRGRRLGFNIERDGKWVESNPSTVSSIFYWDNVGKKDLDYIVVQRGTVLYFFIKDSSQTEAVSSVDLSKYKVTTDAKPLKYSTCAGDLIVVGDWINPVKISYIFDKNEIEVIKVNMKWRDLIGVDDGLRLDEMPEELSPEHKYNLYNQGWDKFVYTGTDNIESKHAIDAFFEEVKLYPSNNMLHFLDKTSDSAEYDTYELLKHFYGNTPAPKGHFILDYFSRSRTATSGITVEGEDAKVEEFYDILRMHNIVPSDTMANKLPNAILADLRWPTTEEDIKKEIETVILPTQPFSSLSFTLRDGCLSNGNSFDNTHSDIYIRRDDVNAKEFYTDQWYIGPIILSVYGVEEDGSRTLLNERTYSFPYSGRVGDIAASDTISFEQTYQYSTVVLKIKLTSIDPKEMSVAGCWRLDTKLVNAGEGSLKTSDVVNGRVKDITTLGGRYFYLVGDTVLFSQVLKDNGEGFDACYQEADPTSEEISDVVPTDGGYVKFPAMGEGQAIESFNRGVIVFGKSNVFGIISPAEQVLSATSYDIVELSRAGLIGPDSVVSTSDQIFYWSPLGIFRIGLSAETGNTVVAQSISINTIQEYYNNIPQFSKQNCVGTFDYVNNRIYWYYPTDASNPYKLNKCLILDLTHGAFMAFEIGSEAVPYISNVTRTPNAYEVRPTIYTRAGEDRVVVDNIPVIAAEEEATFNRWTALKHVIVDSEGRFSFGDYNSREFKDFDTAGYESYMVSKPIMFAGFSAFGKVVQDTANDKQVPILQTLFKRTEQEELNALPKPVEHLYKLNDVRSFKQSWPSQKDAYRAETFIIDDEGLFKSCKFLVDVADFKGSNITVRAYVNDVTVEEKFNKLDKDIVELIIDTPSESVQSFYKLAVMVEANTDAELTGDVHFSAEFVQDRTKPSTKVFTGLKETVVEGTRHFNKTGIPARWRTHVTFPESIVKGVELEAVPNVAEDKNWSVALDSAVTDSGVKFFYMPSGADQIYNYGVSTKAEPIVSPHDKSLVNSRTSTSFSIEGLVSLPSDDTKLRYKLTLLEPVHADVVPVKKPKKYIGESGANIRMRWGWSLNDRSNRWDMIQNGYRPQKDFLHDEYVESRIHVRGRGKAFQVEIRNDDNKDFRLAGMNLMVRS